MARPSPQPSPAKGGRGGRAAGVSPERAQAAEGIGHPAHGLGVVDLAREPGQGRLHKYCASDREAPDEGAPPRGLKCAGQIFLGRFEAQHHDPSAQRIASLDRSADPLPRGASRLPLELPPVGLDADPIEARNDAGDRVVIDGAILARDDFDQQFAPDGARGVV